MVGRKPLSGPLSLSLVCVFKRPKSRSKDEIYHTSKPDFDNLEKWIGDAGNKILWHDDSQIAESSFLKVFGDVPKTILTVRRLDDTNKT